MSRSVTLKDMEAEVLRYHEIPIAGKISISLPKVLSSPAHLSLAYSPGVAIPCLKIAESPEKAYNYTSKGRLIAVISNGTAVLGLGNLGALASKPVMEGKSALFKNFGGVDAIDIEVNTEDVESFIQTVKNISVSFGGINLEDIKAPECFIIEERLKKETDIPVFHDDQHGTAICTLAGLINALDITHKKPEDIKLVINGAGAAAVACADLAVRFGVKQENVVMCDTKGVVYKGRENLNQWKERHATSRNLKTLEEAMVGADVFYGLSKADTLTEAMLLSMAKNPIIFAMANPDPEIEPNKAKAIRKDVIIATGRSDYPNQVNNLLAFPYIFRGALDVRATKINDDMKIAAAHAVASLAKTVPEQVSALYGSLEYGPNYIIPSPFDPRLLSVVPLAVAKEAIRTGVARVSNFDLDAYGKKLFSEMDPTTVNFHFIHNALQGKNKRVLFTEAWSEQVLRAAHIFQKAGYGKSVLVGDKARVLEQIKKLNMSEDEMEFVDFKSDDQLEVHAPFLYEKNWRKGLSLEDCKELLKSSSTLFGATMLKMGKVDALVTGSSVPFGKSFERIRMVVDKKEGETLMGMTILYINNRVFFVADTHVNEYPDAKQLSMFAVQAAREAKRLGFTPRVALLSQSSFGDLDLTEVRNAGEAIHILDKMKVDFEYEGEMTVTHAVNYPLLKETYPKARLTGPANVLIMPGIRTAKIGIDLLQSFGNIEVLGSVLLGLDKPVEFVNKVKSVSEMVNCACLAAFNAVKND